MRIANWRSKEAFAFISDRAMANANNIMDDVVVKAKAACPDDPTEREGKFGKAFVSFTPKKGKNRGNLVEFSTDKRWTGRYQGQLRNTIRRVNSPGKGTVRVYAGNFKVYYAFMVEKSGYHAKTKGGGRNKFKPPIPFLRNSFKAAKPTILNRLKNG